MTVNLGPTFLSGALAANAGAVMDEPSCPLVQVNVEGESVWIIDLTQGPYRHYVLNAIWILINLLCIILTIYHLRKLYRDFTKSNIEALRVHRMFSVAVQDETQQVMNHSKILLKETPVVLKLLKLLFYVRLNTQKFVIDKTSTKFVQRWVRLYKFESSWANFKMFRSV